MASEYRFVSLVVGGRVFFCQIEILCVSVWNSEERESSEVERQSKAVSFSVPSLFAVRLK